MRKGKEGLYGRHLGRRAAVWLADLLLLMPILLVMRGLGAFWRGIFFLRLRLCGGHARTRSNSGGIRRGK